MNNGYKRTMGATERMRLWFPNINVVMTTRIKGSVEEHDLRAAIDKARRKHPLLGVRVELDADGAGWFTTQGVPEIPLEVRPRATDHDWLAQTKAELAHSWPVGKGPLARFVLLHSDSASDLVVNAHHSICDARSLAYLFRDILTFMAEDVDITEIQPVIPIPLEEAVPASASGGPLYRFLMDRMNKKWQKKGITFTEGDYQRMHQAFWETHEASIEFWSLGEAETSHLVSRCRERQISVNSALYTAFLAAQHHVQGSARKEFGNVLVPVDFRDYLRQRTGQALGFYSSAIQLKFEYRPGKPFWTVAQAFDDKTKQRLTEDNIFASQRINALHPSVLDGVAFSMFGDLDDKMASGLAERMQGKMRTGILVSNLGRLDVPVDYGDLHLAAITPPAIYAGNVEKAVELLTIGGQMYFTLTYDQSVIARDTVRAIRETTMQILTAPEGWQA